MASVTLETVYLSLASDLSQVLQLDVPELKDSDAVPGEVRRYANGRTRSVTRAGTARSIPLEPDWVTRSEVATLLSWRGLTVLFRDPFGRKVWGVFYTVETEEYLVAATGSRASLVLTELSYTEVA